MAMKIVDKLLAMRTILLGRKPIFLMSERGRRYARQMVHKAEEKFSYSLLV